LESKSLVIGYQIDQLMDYLEKPVALPMVGRLWSRYLAFALSNSAIKLVDEFAIRESRIMIIFAYKLLHK